MKRCLPTSLWSFQTFIVDISINGTRQAGAVGNRTYRIGLHSVRLETAPTGLDKSNHDSTERR